MPEDYILELRQVTKRYPGTLALDHVDLTIRRGEVHAITHQSAESDGAIPMQLAAEWLGGKEIPEVRYLPIRIITKDNVKEYLPPQWRNV